MRLAEVFRFELGLQARRTSTWLYFAVLAAISFHMMREMNVSSARSGGFFFNPPSALAEATLLAGTMALLAFAAVAGDAGARDVQTRMHPLFYTTPVGRLTYLGGRFLAALALNAALLLAVPAGLLLAALAPGVEAELVAPFPAGSYLRPDGAWRVTMVVDARKVAVDTADVETVVPMDDFVEVGVYAAAEDGGRGEPLYLRMHRIRSGEQRITVTVPREPGSAGVDPRNLLIDVVPGDNVVEVRAGRGDGR